MNNTLEIEVINKILSGSSFSVPLPPGYSYTLRAFNPEVHPNWGLYAIVRFDGSVPGKAAQPVYTAISTPPLCPSSVYDPGHIEKVFTQFRESIRSAAAEHYATVVKEREKQP